MDGRFRPFGLMLVAMSVILLFSLVIVLFAIEACASQTLYVDGDSPAGGNGTIGRPYDHIEFALQNSSDGDTIRVFNGTYIDNIVVNASVHLIGNGTGHTVLDGSDGGDTVKITADHVNLSGFHIISGGTGSGPGHGIFLSNVDHILIEDNVISRNNGSGILLYDSSNTLIEDNIIFDNRVGIELSGENTYSRNTIAQRNNIFNHRSLGIDASDNGDQPILAINNYWGHSSGPSHPQANPEGLGDKVTDFVDFDPWTGKNRPPNVDLYVTHYFNTSQEINDTNDPLVNGQIDVFYGDRVFFFSDVFDRDGDHIVSYDWTFLCVSTEFRTHDFSDVISGIVGEDFLYQGLNGTTPIPPTTARDYQVTLRVMDSELATSEKSYFIRVHPWATRDWVKPVKMGATILNATVTLTWRGFVEEAADTPEQISEEMPVYVFIDENATSPDPNLPNQGGIGRVYDISAVGCYLQNGEEGFIKATIRIPILTSDLEPYGDPWEFKDCLELNYYDQIEKRYIVVERSYEIDDGGVKYVVGEVEHFSIYTAILNYWCKQPEIVPDLSVYKIEFSRSPILNGQEVEIRAHIRNTGTVSARNVDVKIYDGDDLIGDQRLDIVPHSGESVIMKETFAVTMRDPDQLFEYHYIKVFVNKQRSINEGSQNYKNNEGSKLLVVVGVPDEEREEERERGDDEVNSAFLFGVTLFILAEVLVLVVRTPREYFERGGLWTRKGKEKGERPKSTWQR